MPTSAWEKSDLLLLITKYEQQKALWDSKYDGFYSKEDKNAAWQSIAKDMGIEVDDAKNKMQNLLCSFRRENKNRIRITRAGGVYKSKWYAFNAFQFLIRPHRKIVTTVALEDTSQLRGDPLQSIDDNDDDPMAYIVNKTPSSNAQVAFGSNVFLKPNTKVKLRNIQPKPAKSTPSNTKQKTILKPVKINGLDMLSKQGNATDSSTLTYAKYLAEKLNQFDSLTRSVLFHKFNTLIFEAEMIKFSSSPSPNVSVSISPSVHNISAGSSNLTLPKINIRNNTNNSEAPSPSTSNPQKMDVVQEVEIVSVTDNCNK